MRGERLEARTGDGGLLHSMVREGSKGRNECEAFESYGFEGWQVSRSSRPLEALLPGWYLIWPDDVGYAYYDNYCVLAGVVALAPGTSSQDRLDSTFGVFGPERIASSARQTKRRLLSDGVRCACRQECVGRAPFRLFRTLGRLWCFTIVG
jgi:hypothetical protein